MNKTAEKEAHYDHYDEVNKTEPLTNKESPGSSEPDLAETGGRRQSVALNIVENPLQVSATKHFGN